jgi:hypothetical protein
MAFRKQRLNRPDSATLVRLISGATIVEGELHGSTIVLRVESTQSSKIEIRIPAPWDYTSCLGVVSSDTLDISRQDFCLDEILIGIVGAKLTGVEMDSSGVVLECDSIRIEKRFLDGISSIEIKQYTMNE